MDPLVLRYIATLPPGAGNWYCVPALIGAARALGGEFNKRSVYWARLYSAGFTDDMDVEYFAEAFRFAAALLGEDGS